MQRTGVNGWFDSTVYSRMNDKETGAIVIIMQRLHEDDLIGHLMEQGGWELLSFPAIAEEDEVHHIETILGPYTCRRAIGEALHPDRESLIRLEEAKMSMGSYNFAAQYQQRPAPAGGGMIKANWFLRYDPTSPPTWSSVIQSWDCASKKSELADYSVCTTWGVEGDRYYLLHVYREKVDFPEMKAAVIRQADMFKANIVLIEDASSGIQLLQQLQVDGFHKAQAVKVTDNKVMRMHAQTSAIEAGRMYLPTQAGWLDAYINEMTMFPNGRNDDQVDSTAQVLNYLTNLDIPAQWVAYYARLAEEAQGAW